MAKSRGKGFLRRMANGKRAYNLKLRKRRAREKRAREARKVTRKA